MNGGVKGLQFSSCQKVYSFLSGFDISKGDVSSLFFSKGIYGAGSKDIES